MDNKQDPNFIDRLKKIPNDLRHLVEKRLELFGLEYSEKFSAVASKAASTFVTLIFVLIAFLFLLFSVAFYLSEIFNSHALGFGLTSTFLFVISLIVYLLSPELIEEKVKRSLLSSFSDKNNSKLNTDLESSTSIESMHKAESSLSNGSNTPSQKNSSDA